jgi:DNA-binding IclR family transcriptional regulator
MGRDRTICQQICWAFVEERRPLSVSELRLHTGLDAVGLHPVLHAMHRAGLLRCVGRDRVDIIRVNERAEGF